MGSGQNAKHQPVMIHPSISHALSSPLFPLLTGDGQHAADRPEREEEEKEEEKKRAFLPHPLALPLALGLALVVTLWRPCSSAFPLSLHLFVLSRAI